jgi:hypothetical protein
MTTMQAHRAMTPDGRALHPSEGVVPIVHEIGPGRLLVVGTGFYVSRYGLFVTAGHVVHALVNDGSREMDVAYVLHLADDGRQCHLRRILRAYVSNEIDVAVAQADNYAASVPEGPLCNLRAPISTGTPPKGTELVTYAYPDNAVLDFTDGSTPQIKADFYDGHMLEVIEDPRATPFMPYPHYRTSIELRSGASGGPVFHDGRVVGVNCRGWDFRGGEHEGDNLSHVVPAAALLPLEIGADYVPPASWEYRQIPDDRRGHRFTFGELATLGHILVDD